MLLLVKGGRGDDRRQSVVLTIDPPSRLAGTGRDWRCSPDQGALTLPEIPASGKNRWMCRTHGAAAVILRCHQTPRSFGRRAAPAPSMWRGSSGSPWRSRRCSRGAADATVSLPDTLADPVVGRAGSVPVGTRPALANRLRRAATGVRASACGLTRMSDSPAAGARAFRYHARADPCRGRGACLLRHLGRSRDARPAASRTVAVLMSSFALRQAGSAPRPPAGQPAVRRVPRRRGR